MSTDPGWCVKTFCWDFPIYYSWTTSSCSLLEYFLIKLVIIIDEWFSFSFVKDANISIYHSQRLQVKLTIIILPSHFSIFGCLKICESSKQIFTRSFLEVRKKQNESRNRGLGAWTTIWYPWEDGYTKRTRKMTASINWGFGCKSWVYPKNIIQKKWGGK